MTSSRSISIYLLLFLLVLILFVIDVCFGTVNIPFSDVWGLISGKAIHPGNRFIIIDFRLPKAITAIAAGAALSVSGLVMQTFFRNPLAGPYVLGISSGANLGVALLVMAGSFFGGLLQYGQWGIIVAGLLGAAAVLSLVMSASIKINDSVSLLIIGLMFGSFTSAVVSLLQYFSIPELIQAYLFWTFGTLSGVGWEQLWFMLPGVGLGLIIAFILQKNLNLLLLGENYAISLGLNLKLTRYLIVASCCLLAGIVTSFCGPIAFLGLAVPHLTRGLFKTADHRILIPATAFLGAGLLLLCDICTQVPGKDITLPINALTSLIGAPVVIGIIVRRNRRQL